MYNNYTFIANELVKILITKKGGANTTNQIRTRIRSTPSSKQIKIREYEYEPSAQHGITIMINGLRAAQQQMKSCRSMFPL